MESLDRPYILYYGRYYTSPPGYFVGLKGDRLSNKDTYKYLVMCYRTNHLERTNSITYKYVYDKVEDTNILAYSYRS